MEHLFLTMQIFTRGHICLLAQDNNTGDKTLPHALCVKPQCALEFFLSGKNYAALLFLLCMCMFNFCFELISNFQQIQSIRSQFIEEINGCIEYVNWFLNMFNRVGAAEPNGIS